MGKGLPVDLLGRPAEQSARVENAPAPSRSSDKKIGIILQIFGNVPTTDALENARKPLIRRNVVPQIGPDFYAEVEPCVYGYGFVFSPCVLIWVSGAKVTACPDALLQSYNANAQGNPTIHTVKESFVEGWKVTFAMPLSLQVISFQKRLCSIFFFFFNNNASIFQYKGRLYSEL